MFKKIVNKILPLAVATVALINPVSVQAADIAVVPPAGQAYGAHEIWAHNEMGQSFVASTTQVKAGFYVIYSPQSAALMAPNASITQLFAKLYDGEGIDSTKLLKSTAFTVDTIQNGFLDVDYAAAGITLVSGNKYTLGITSPDNRGWIVPSVCDYLNLDASGQPTGAYADGHPFFNGVMVTDETGICDNAFHVIDVAGGVPPTVSPTPTPSPTSTPSPIVQKTLKKVDKVGVIKKITPLYLVVNKTTLYLTPTAVIKLNYYPSLSVGLKINYKGYKNADGSVTATFIEVK
ncbi:MAG: hypothetical protein AAB874_03235 [Patescibacteria group bacterium]